MDSLTLDRWLYIIGHSPYVVDYKSYQSQPAQSNDWDGGSCSLKHMEGDPLDQAGL